MKEARPPLWNWSETERQDRDGWGIVKVVDHIPRYSTPSWSTVNFWVRVGLNYPLLALLTLNNQFVIYSPNLKLLILFFVKAKWKDSKYLEVNPSWVRSGFSVETQFWINIVIWVSLPSLSSPPDWNLRNRIRDAELHGTDLVSGGQFGFSRIMSPLSLILTKWTLIESDGGQH